MASVWLVETGDYEQRCVVLVADTLDNAVAEIKVSRHKNTKWNDLMREHDTWVLKYSVGHTNAAGHRYKETVSFYFYEWPIYSGVVES